jgi:hypothetical protein
MATSEQELVVSILRSMCDPKSIEELNERVKANSTFTGYYLDVTAHQPCPFCGAPDFQVYKVINSREALARPSTCLVCGRSGRFIVRNDATSTAFVFVQTGGAPVPDWYYPKPAQYRGTLKHKLIMGLKLLRAPWRIN